jgi:GPH family glycoside/pentoside/hexuronide:cation symporter
MDTTNNQKLPLKVKIGFSFGTFSNNLLLIFNNLFLLYYFTDAAMIPASAATVILTIARVWDAINDPMMGLIVERHNSTKYGKCGFWLRYFSIPAGIVVFLSYFCPDFVTSGRIIWVGVMYILQGMAQTVISVPSNTLMLRITSSGSERVSINQIGGIFVMVVNVIVPAVTLPLVKFFGKGDQRIGFGWLAIFIAVIYSTCSMIRYLSCRNYEHDTVSKTQADKDSGSGNDSTDSEYDDAKKIGVKQRLKIVFTNKYALTVCIAYCFYLVLAALMSSTMVYYVKYTVGKPELMSYYSAVSLVASVAAIGSMGLLYKKFGSAKTAVIACTCVIIGSVIRWITGDALAGFIVGVTIFGFGTLLIGQFSMQSIMDACDYSTLTTGISNEAVVMSVFTFFQKFGGALGSVIASALLAAFHYKGGSDVVSAAVKRLFFAENIIIPILIAIATGLCFMITIRYEKKLNVLRAQRGGAGESEA